MVSVSLIWFCSDLWSLEVLLSLYLEYSISFFYLVHGLSLEWQHSFCFIHFRYDSIKCVLALTILAPAGMFKH